MKTENIGEEIKAVFDASEHTIAWLAKKLSCDRSNVYNIFCRKSIDTNLLYELSEILHYDFFVYYKPKV